MTGGRASLRICAALFALACVFWIFWVPCDSMAVFRCIPSDAAVVTVHDNLAGRWDSIRQGMLFDTLAASDTGAVANIDAVFADPGFAKWFGRLAARRTVLAYSRGPGMGFQKWYFASRVGGTGRRLRWLAEARLARDLKPGAVRNGDRIWNVKVKGLGRGRRLSVIIEDGLLMGCISADSNGVMQMAGALNSERVGAGREPVGSIAGMDRASGVAVLWEGGAPDRGWLNVPQAPASYGLELLENTARGCAVRAWTGEFTGEGLPVFRQADLDDLAAIFGNAPQAACVAPVRSVAFGAEYLQCPGWVRDAADLMKEAAAGSTNGCFLACLVGGEFSGRLKSVVPPDFAGVLTNGLATPVVMCAVSVSDAGLAAELCSGFAERVNKRQGMKLFAEQDTVNGCGIWYFGSASSNDYGRLLRDERFAVALCGNWLVGASNAGALERLLERRRNTNSVIRSVTPAWQAAMPAGGTSFHVWADLAAAGQSVQNAMGLWKMSLGDNASSRRARASAADVMSWAERIGKLKTLRGRADRVPSGGIEAQFRIGETGQAE